MTVDVQGEQHWFIERRIGKTVHRKHVGSRCYVTLEGIIASNYFTLMALLWMADVFEIFLTRSYTFSPRVKRNATEVNAYAYRKNFSQGASGYSGGNPGKVRD
jgi:hypothetical protein